MRSWVQVLETTSCRNAGKGCVHKTQSSQTLPQTLHMRELCALGCPFLLCMIKSEACINSCDAYELRHNLCDVIVSFTDKQRSET
jgi:hypothetical protein